MTYPPTRPPSPTLITIHSTPLHHDLSSCIRIRCAILTIYFPNSLTSQASLSELEKLRVQLIEAYYAAVRPIYSFNLHLSFSCPSALTYSLSCPSHHSFIDSSFPFATVSRMRRRTLLLRLRRSRRSLSSSRPSPLLLLLRRWRSPRLRSLRLWRW